MKELVLIVAVSENNVIGFNGKIPWFIQEDLKRFRNLTLGNSVVMGRKTFESIGKPLEKRQNIVLTERNDFFYEGIEIAHSLDEALRLANREKVFFIGGRKVYENALNVVDRMEITLVRGSYEGDIFFPRINYEDWLEKTRLDKEGYSFLTYIRKK